MLYIIKYLFVTVLENMLDKFGGGQDSNASEIGLEPKVEGLIFLARKKGYADNAQRDHAGPRDAAEGRLQF